jgi:SulP family sulfate permease
MGGLFQILFGIFRLGSYVRLMPYPVVSGFMSGIGCIIIILQIGPFFGHANPPGGTIPALLAFPNFALHPVRDGLIVGAVSLAIVYLTPKAIAKLVPTPIIALIVGTLLVLYLLPEASIIGNIPTGLPQPHLPTFSMEALPDMVQSALVLALLGAIDSLLTSLIADNVTRTHHESDRELIGQGIGNTIAGLFGAIPGAGATMRTVVNVRAGGRTPISGALHALVLLALVLGLAPLAEHIPHAVLAGILIKVGVDIIDWEYLKRIHRAPRAGVFFMLVVLVLTVFVDLIMAVGVGVVMASLLFVKRMSDLQIEDMKLIVGPAPEAELTEAETAALAATGGHVVLLQPGGPLSFGAAKEVGRRLTGLDEYDVLVIDLTRVPMIDSSAALAIEDVIRQSEDHGKPVLLCGLTPRVKRVMEQLGVLGFLPAGHVKDDRLAAIEEAAKGTVAPA